VVNAASDVVEAGKINPIMIFKKINMEKTQRMERFNQKD